jgi:hypothetical protein
MRVHVALCAAVVVACMVLSTDAVPASANPNGTLAGLTQITYGCPGPQRVGQQCERWSIFAHARFALTRNRADGAPMPSTRRVVVSNGSGHFSLVLAVGTYTIAPLAQPHTHSGRTLTARVRAGQTTRIAIRFLGYPMMV